jgi:hypothetical protein
LLTLEVASASYTVLPALTHAMMAAAAVVWMTVPWHCWRSVAPLCRTMTTAAVQMTVPWYCQPSSTCSRKDDSSGGGAKDGALASLAVPPLLAHAMTAAVAVPMTVPWHCQLSLACLRNNDDDNGGDGMNDSTLALFAIPACLLDDNNSSGSGTDDSALALLAVCCSLASDNDNSGGADDSALVLSAILHLLMQRQRRWWQCK